ncbi:hypothetical protein GLOTRDRAFT_43985, partial [Gloeophyllum trabeum ATCC 11539]
DDIIRENTRLLFRDLLLVLELDTSTSAGDWGRIEDVLGTFACAFRGAGSNKYANEILHFLHGLKVIWTPQFA